MAAKIVATWNGAQELSAKITEFDRRMNKIIAGQVMFAKPEAVAYAKKKAPWTDRTGNARAGLNAEVNIGENFAELVLAHAVSYGIWLEVRFSGKYAIISPTINHIGALILKRLEHSLDQLGAQ